VSLLTLADIIDDLRIENPDVEGPTLDRYLREAIARVKALAKQRDTLIGQAERTFSHVTSYRDRHGRSVLLLPMWPVLETGPAPVILDYEGVTVTATNYTLNARLGRFEGISGYYFSTVPYEITATVGLATLGDEYVAEIEPVINSAIRDIVADLYQHRNPASSSESTAGVSVSYGNGGGLPERVRLALDDVLPTRVFVG
jgi:hypothetical protein